MWQPNWVKTPPEEFQVHLRQSLDQAAEGHGGWVVEGNYERRGGLIAFEESTDVICKPTFCTRIFRVFPIILTRVGPTPRCLSSSLDLEDFHAPLPNSGSMQRRMLRKTQRSILFQGKHHMVVYYPALGMSKTLHGEDAGDRSRERGKR